MGVASVVRRLLSKIFRHSGFLSNRAVQAGDYIKLDSGEEGYVLSVTRSHISIKGLDGASLIVPSRKLSNSGIKNYGKSVKTAKNPFRFHTRLQLKEVTGIRCSNLNELLQGLKVVPDSVIYYHTHNFVEEHHFLTPEPPNDFAFWVADAVGDQELGEKLAFIDPMHYPTLAAIRANIIKLVEESLSSNDGSRKVHEGRELHFIKCISVNIPTPYIVHDLREFVEVLKHVSVNSLYFHMFESKLRLHRGANDFSIWIEDNLDDAELARQIALLDPYSLTLEGLRAALIQLVEK